MLCKHPVTQPCSMNLCRSSCTDLLAGCLQSVPAARRPGQGAAGAQHELPACAWQPSLPHTAAADPGMCMTKICGVEEVLPYLEHACFWEADGAAPALLLRDFSKAMTCSSPQGCVVLAGWHIHQGDSASVSPAGLLPAAAQLKLVQPAGVCAQRQGPHPAPLGWPAWLQPACQDPAAGRGGSAHELSLNFLLETSSKQHLSVSLLRSNCC